MRRIDESNAVQQSLKLSFAAIHPKTVWHLPTGAKEKS
jgi:hypothetical protein